VKRRTVGGDLIDSAPGDAFSQRVNAVAGGISAAAAAVLVVSLGLAYIAAEAVRVDAPYAARLMGAELRGSAGLQAQAHLDALSVEPVKTGADVTIVLDAPAIEVERIPEPSPTPSPSPSGVKAPSLKGAKSADETSAQADASPGDVTPEAATRDWKVDASAWTWDDWERWKRYGADRSDWPTWDDDADRGQAKDEDRGDD
jgi:hypothetical protein